MKLQNFVDIVVWLYFNALLLSASESNEPSRGSIASIAFVHPIKNLTSRHLQTHLFPFLNEFSGELSITPSKDAGRGNEFAISHPTEPVRLVVNPVNATSMSINALARQVFCSPAAQGLNAVFILVDKVVQGEAGSHLANFLTMLANAAGLPAIIWSTSAYELESGDKNAEIPRFLLTPSIRSQARAVFAYIRTHPWQKIALIESLQTPGHDIFAEEFHKEFERETKESEGAGQPPTFFDHEQHSGSRLTRVVQLGSDWRVKIRNTLVSIRDTDKGRFIVLYCNKEEAGQIFDEARTHGMTSTSFNWVGAKPILGDDDMHTQAILFSPGAVVVTYETSHHAQVEALKAAALIWSTAVRKLSVIQQQGLKTSVSKQPLSPSDICNSRLSPEWPLREKLIEFIKESKIPSGSREKKEKLEFDAAGTMELNGIVLLSLNARRQWVKFGEWFPQHGLRLNVTELSHANEQEEVDTAILRIVTLQEKPYVYYENLNRKTGSCPRATVPCKLSPLVHFTHAELKTSEQIDEADDNIDMAITKMGHDANDSWACCAGFCIDLLRRLSDDLGFRYQLFEVPDRKWGVVKKDGVTWNGLVKEVMTGGADFALTSLKINKERSEAIDFTLPFVETGIAILVGVRDAGTSATAFLEPFSLATWFVILVCLINTCAIAIFLFEFANSTLDDSASRRNAKRKIWNYTPMSALWVSWSMLFRATVKAKIPNSVGARLLISIWGMFSVIFSSSYMANMAVFMISKEEYLDLTGLQDPRLTNPFSKNPPFVFATVGSGATETFLRKTFPDLYEYMRPFNKSSVDAGVESVKNGSLDAFVYDAKVLEYKAGSDRDCKLKVVGKWYATTGYAIGFPKGSKWMQAIDKKLIDYQHNGFIEQLTEFWLTGDCKRHKKEESEKSNQLNVTNFGSVFTLLVGGIALSCVILICEHFLFKYCQHHIKKSGRRRVVDLWQHKGIIAPQPTLPAQLNKTVIQKELPSGYSVPDGIALIPDKDAVNRIIETPVPGLDIGGSLKNVFGVNGHYMFNAEDSSYQPYSCQKCKKRYDRASTERSYNRRPYNTTSV